MTPRTIGLTFLQPAVSHTRAHPTGAISATSVRLERVRHTR